MSPVRRGVRALALLTCLSFVACGSDPPGPGDEGSECAQASDCNGTLVCNPSGQCSSDVPCATHGDCGNGSFCADAGKCEQNTTGGPCANDGNCNSGDSCMAGFCGCGGEFFQAENVPPNVLITLDRSGSMDDPVGGTPKWDIALTALESLLSTYADSIRFGLVLYQGEERCDPGEIEVDIGEMTAEQIRGALTATSPNGRTPIGDTLAALVDYPGLEDPERANYILLITDGEETCEGDGLAAVTELRNQTPDIKTFVIGFGGEVDPDALNGMAMAGGTALPGDTAYYQADDAAQLEAAFNDIGGTVLSCTYHLDSAPASSDGLFVYFDQLEVPQDAGNGWDYDPASNQITFSGEACDSLRAGDVDELVIVHGCPITVD